MDIDPIRNAQEFREQLHQGNRSWATVQFFYTIFFGLGMFGAGIVFTLFVIGVTLG